MPTYGTAGPAVASRENGTLQPLPGQRCTDAANAVGGRVAGRLPASRHLGRLRHLGEDFAPCRQDTVNTCLCRRVGDDAVLARALF